MNRYSRIFHCGDSRALELFLGLFQVAVGVRALLGHATCAVAHSPAGGVLLLVSGALYLASAPDRRSRVRSWASASSVASCLLVAITGWACDDGWMTWGLFAAASMWAWSRTNLDTRLERE